MVQNIKMKMTYLIVVAFWVFLGHFKRFFSFDRWKVSNGQNSKIAWNAPETPRTHKNTTTIR